MPTNQSSSKERKKSVFLGEKFIKKQNIYTVNFVMEKKLLEKGWDSFFLYFTASAFESVPQLPVIHFFYKTSITKQLSRLHDYD